MNKKELKVGDYSYTHSKDYWDENLKIITEVNEDSYYTIEFYWDCINPGVDFSVYSHAYKKDSEELKEFKNQPIPSGIKRELMELKTVIDSINFDLKPRKIKKVSSRKY